MKIGKLSISLASIVALAFQLALVCSIAAKYLYQRSTCPRVWVRTVAYDPETVMRGRYLSVQLTVDGCQSTLPSAEDAVMPRDINGVPTGTRYTVRNGLVSQLEFRARLKVDGNRLVAVRVPESQESYVGQWVTASPGSSCNAMRLQEPVNFYLSENAKDPTPAWHGHWDAQHSSWTADPNASELWVEVTVPPKGPPRPTQLALKENGVWKPIAFE
jgi:uncharacterized membrane-anchored protein